MRARRRCQYLRALPPAVGPCPRAARRRYASWCCDVAAGAAFGLGAYGAAIDAPLPAVFALLALALCALYAAERLSRKSPAPPVRFRLVGGVASDGRARATYPDGAA